MSCPIYGDHNLHFPLLHICTGVGSVAGVGIEEREIVEEEEIEKGMTEVVENVRSETRKAGDLMERLSPPFKLWNVSSTNSISVCRGFFCDILAPSTVMYLR